MSEQLPIAINVAPKIDPTSGKGGRAELATALLEMGADPIITKSADYDEEAGEVAGLRVLGVSEGANFETEPVTLSLDAIGAIRNTHAPLGMHPGELNPTVIRAELRDRRRVLVTFANVGYERIFGQLYGTESDDLIALQDLDEVVLRPRLGLQAGTKPVVPETVPFAEIGRRLQNGSLVGIAERDRWIVEAKPQDTEPVSALPDAMRGGKLLRVISFGYNQGEPVTSTVVRNATETGVSWQAVAPHEVPHAVTENVAAIIKELQVFTDENEFHIAVDYVRGGQRNNGLVLENIVGAEPNLAVGDAELRQRHAAMLARQLIRVAQAGGTK